ncbi:hypothetical protein [Clostridium tertium]|uniref:hypothetical protein n=1 Tax=Clostridium tertium TaxID=1559 RepID=UPI0020282157|nr:hypothetical protein [Clostridium tertium]
MFDWGRFKNGEIAVHCDTEEKADDFLKECEKRNIKWIGGDNATHHNHYSVNFGLTCYCGKKGVLTYSDKVYFIQEGTTIVKWEVKEVKERTFKEVIANIKEGEVWESTIKTVSLINGAINIERKNKIETYYIYIKESELFKLQRKEYTFQEAFKAYEEGKEIESCEGCKFKRCDKDVVLIIDFAGDKIKRSSCEELFSIKEIRGKWYIND